MTHFRVSIFPNIEAPKVPTNILRNAPFLYFVFTVLLIPVINTPEFSSDFVTLIISSKSSFEMTKVIPFPTLTVHLPRISF